MRQTREAIDHYGMIEPRARWLDCPSGEKDSYTPLAVLHELKWRSLLLVGLLACNLDQGQLGFPATVLPEFLKARGVDHQIEYQDTYSIVMRKVPQGRTITFNQVYDYIYLSIIFINYIHPIINPLSFVPPWVKIVVG